MKNAKKQQEQPGRLTMVNDHGDRIVLPTIVGAPAIPAEDAKRLCRGVIEKRKIAFLVALAQLGNKARAARASGVTETTVYLWRKDDANFEKAFNRAREIASELLESEAIRRAAEGVVKPVFQKGTLVGGVREYSDTLLIFLLKGQMPDKYADRIKFKDETDVADRLRRGRERALGRGGVHEYNADVKRRKREGGDDD